MGIVKVNLRRFDDDDNDDDVLKSSSLSAVNDLKHKKVLHYSNQLDVGFHNSEPTVTDSELVVLGDQTFNVPYDLYDLPDLKGVLSPEIWNVCLSEDERFSLSAYLPDMDQQTFLLTINELLKGENIFFGSPLDCLFQRLKGGLCVPEVSCLRKRLQDLEKQKHYHSLSSYHSRMVHLFIDMKGTWSSCQPSISAKERIHIWKKRNENKPAFVVDLNALPAEEELSTRGSKDEDTNHSLKRARYMDNKEDPPHSFPASAKTTVPPVPVTKPRGVLKIKPLESNSTQTGAVQALKCGSWGTRPTPKGILKVKPRNVPLHSQEKTRPSTIQPETRYETPSLHASTFSHELVPTSKPDKDLYVDDSHFPHPDAKGENSRISEFTQHINNVHREDLPTQNNGSVELKDERFPWKTFQKPGAAYHKFEGLRKETHNIDLQRREFFSGAMETDTLAPGCFQDRRNVTPLSTAVSRTTTVINSEPERFPLSNRGSRHENSDGIRSKPHAADIPGSSRVFPITYKRKKGSSKHNTSDSSTHKVSVGQFESRLPAGTDYPPDGKAKPLKIKLKLWKKAQP